VISPDGRTLGVTGALQTTRLWDIHDPARPALLAVLSGAGSPVAFTADSHAVAVIDPTGAVIPRLRRGGSIFLICRINRRALRCQDDGLS
jgi:hypothetical protein